jgi:hypothetical protein
MRALAVTGIVLLSACVAPLPSTCFEEATEGECVVWEEPVYLPPRNAEEEQRVLTACNSPCVVARREVKLARSSSERQPVPLLKKIRHPFPLQASESDRGIDLDIGPIPGLASLSVVDSTSLRSLKGLDTPREINVRILRSPALESLEGIPSTTLGLSLQELNLTSLRGLSALTSLGGLDLERLPGLREIDHLDALTDVGSLVIDGTGLTSLNGFSPDLKVQAGYIQGNLSLSDCEARDFAARVVKPGLPGGGIRVAENGPCP